MENTEEIYLDTINDFVNNIVFLFPNDHLGVADKLILSNIIRKEGKLFGENMMCYNFINIVNDEMKKYGFIGFQE